MSSGFAFPASTNCRSKTVVSIQSWESSDVEGQLYALFYTILYKGLEHPQILISVGDPGTNNAYISRKNWRFLEWGVGWGSEVMHRFAMAWGSVLLNPVLVEGQLYIPCNPAIPLTNIYSKKKKKENIHYQKLVHTCL